MYWFVPFAEPITKAFNTLIELMSYTCITAWVVVVLLVPFIILVRFCESEDETIYRLREEGRSYKWISQRMRVFVYRVRKEFTSYQIGLRLEVQVLSACRIQYWLALEHVALCRVFRRYPLRS